MGAAKATRDWDARRWQALRRTLLQHAKVLLDPPPAYGSFYDGRLRSLADTLRWMKELEEEIR